METISFHSYRGGVGKTLLSINSAVKLANLGKKVCLVDFDLRAPSLQSYLSTNSIFSQSEENIRSFTEFLIENADPKEVISKTNNDKFDCVFSNVEILQKSTKIRTKLAQHGEGRILAKLFEFIRYCNTVEYDFLIIDCMPGITFRSLDALVVSDKIMVVTRPVKSEAKGLSLLISECYSKLEGANFYAIMNQIEAKIDLKTEPNPEDVRIVQKNLQEISHILTNSSIDIPIFHSFRRIPFVTERIYVLEDQDHPFSQEITTFCDKML
ncbi:MAG: ParA family protein, partial [Candidatus Hodarchaeales archaeon]